MKEIESEIPENIEKLETLSKRFQKCSKIFNKIVKNTSEIGENFDSIATKMEFF